MDASVPGRVAYSLPELDVPEAELPPQELLRSELLLPEVTENYLIRYFVHLSRLNWGVDVGFYPLGSCTMKYNPKYHEDLAGLPGNAQLHPLQPQETVQGALELMHRLQDWLAETTGMDATSLCPAAGAHGELTGAIMAKAYFAKRGENGRKKVLVPDSAHGTNPATASMGGFEVVTIPSDKQGNVDLEALSAALSPEVAVLMLTLPNTLGLFDPHIVEICDAVHQAGAFVYGDGANMNALLGRARIGELGFDVIHLNLHKTFSTPHGGGGPGAGPICVKENLATFLPDPVVVRSGEGTYAFQRPANTIGKIGGFYGNFGILVRAYAYLRFLGHEGLREISGNAVINANYLMSQLRGSYLLPYDRSCMHEVVFSGAWQRAKGVRTSEIAKRIIDYGFHPPTVYFPLTVDEAMMIEPTETESRETLDAFIAAMKAIAREIEEDPEIVKTAPHNAPMARLDEVSAARKPDLRWRPQEEQT